MSKYQDVAIIVPVYNEGQVVAEVVNEVASIFPNIICINDGSADNSAEEVGKTPAVLIDHPINLGQGAAIQTGIEYALANPKIQYFVTFDADGQHNIKDVPVMLDHLKNKQLDIVIGSRFMGIIHNISPVKKAFLVLAHIFSAFDSGINLSDPHIGLRVFNRKFAEGLNITMPDFEHASEIVHRIKEGNYAYGEMPVSVTYTDYSKAKGQPMLNAVNITFDLLLNRITKR